ncbi:MAG: ABC transporter substrate-binding protein [Bacteroidales bacterium]|nr:ABC transporter substrate-binding protein [Bacteroidales bacterium]
MGIVLTLTNSCKKSETTPPAGGQTINFGALLDLSFDNPEEGLATKAALQFALEDMNSYAATAGQNVTFICSYVDTRLDTTEAKNQLKNMYEKGISMFVGGPFSSSELQAIAPFVEQNPVVVINSISTAIGLNHDGSHIFRIVTDDGFQAKALNRVAITEGVKAVIPIVRNDVWGNALIALHTNGRNNTFRHGRAGTIKGK